MKLRQLLLAPCLFFVSITAFAQAGNGKLQLHFMDVGQGDGAILISPLGETVLFDNGDRSDCDSPLEYLRSINVSRIDYMIVSHYHADHFNLHRRSTERVSVAANCIRQRATTRKRDQNIRTLCSRSR